MGVSVIITSYNYANYIFESIESVIKQTYEDWELIIVDDCSKDNSVEVIKKYLNNPKIKLIKNTKNLGLAKSIQIGIKNAAYEWISFLESDDIWTPNFLEEHIQATEKGADLIFSDVNIFGDEQKIQNLNAVKEDTKEKCGDYTGFIENVKSIFLKTNFIPTFSVVTLKKSLITKCKFNTICDPFLDYYLWSQFSDKKIYHINKELTFWRAHKGSYITNKTFSKFKKTCFLTTIYWNLLSDKNLLIKILYLLNYIRKRIIYICISKKKFKLNILCDTIIYENNFK